MFRPRIIPCLLLENNRLVKTTKFKNPIYIGDPTNAIKIFNDLEADELVLLDISASKRGGVISKEFVKKISDEAFMPLAVGGGINSVKDVQEILSSGAEKIVLNTNSINFDLVKKIVKTFGGQSVIISIDVMKIGEKYSCFLIGGEKNTCLDPIFLAKKMEELGVGEIIINSIDKDGMMEGYDLDLIEMISKAVNIPVISLGGAGNFEDFSQAIKVGASAVAGGSVFVFSGKGKGILINYPDQKEIDNIFMTDNFK